jgi:hypothetical protein
MTRTELAMKLTGRKYGDEMTDEEEQLAKDNGLIVIFGQSDDLIEFRGVIYDEISAWDGTDFIIATPGTKIPVDEDEETYRKAKALEPISISEDSSTNKNRFKAEWCPSDEDCSWRITTDLPNTTFQIMNEDDENHVYCYGVVIEVKDLV